MQEIELDPIRAALAALVKAHNQLLVERAWLLDQLHANIRSCPGLSNALRAQLDRLSDMDSAELSAGRNLAYALEENQEFLSLLQEYVGWSQVTLVDQILSLRVDNFQLKVSG